MRPLLALMLCAVLSGCVDRSEAVYLESFADTQEMQGKRFVIMTKEEVHDNDILWRMMMHKIAMGLYYHGYRWADSIEDADVGVTVLAGEKQSSGTYTYNQPQIGFTPAQTTTTTGRFGNTRYSQQTYTPGQVYVAGSSTQTASYTHNLPWISVNCWDVKNADRTFWRVFCTLETGATDLSRNEAMMVLAEEATDWFQRSSGGKKYLRWSSPDMEPKSFRQGLVIVQTKGGGSARYLEGKRLTPPPKKFTEEEAKVYDKLAEEYKANGEKQMEELARKKAAEIREGL